MASSSAAFNFATSSFPSFDGHSIAAQRLHTELIYLSQFPLQGCQAFPSSEDIFQWIAVIDGPKGTVYEEGTFFVELTFSKNYPFIAPEVVFLTRIYHCNISNEGRVRLQAISRQGWRPSCGVATVLQSIISLLHNCDPYNPLVPFIADQFQQQPQEFNKTARIWTERFAH